MGEALAFHASVGNRLTRYEVDVAGAALTAAESVELPEIVQYLWPHPSRPVVYVASSNGGPGRSGDRNWLSALARDPATGRLTPLGQPAALPHRPIHITVDREGRHVLVAHNIPSALTVHRIEADGAVGGPVAQPDDLDLGIYGHQILVTPSGRAVIMVTRGNDATPAKAEDPGALKVYRYADGRLTNRASIAPGGGYGFGPRHLDFHPTLPLAYVSIERQNQLQVFRLADDSLEPAPAFTAPTLSAPKSTPRQHAGAIHVHPGGGHVYVTERSDAVAEVDGRRIFTTGENGMVMFAIDPATGRPTRIQEAPTHGFVPRTFSIDPSGRLLVAANQEPMTVRDGGTVRTVPASLAIYRIGGDGRLSHARNLEVEVGGNLMFWCGMLGGT